MKIVKKNNVYFLNLDKNEDLVIDKYIEKKLDVLPITKDVLIIRTIDQTTLNKEIQTTRDFASIDSKQKILNFLNNKNLSVKEKLQGSFEKLLSEEDLLVFNEMVKNKEIVLCKLSDKYKNSFYTINKKSSSLDKQKNSVKGKEDMSNSEVIDIFLKNNFVILKNHKDTEDFKREFEEKVNSGQIKGIKSFDGNTYVISLELFVEIKDKILSYSTQSFTLEEISIKFNKEKELIRTVLEILKEEALILEKRKDQFFIVW